MPALPVTDSLANRDLIISNIAEHLTGPNRRAVFEAVYRGKKRCKTVDEIVDRTGLGRKQVLTAGLALRKIEALDQESYNPIRYCKLTHVDAHRRQIVGAAGRPAKIKAIREKRVGTAIQRVAQIRMPLSVPPVTYVAIDDIDSFRKVKKVRAGRTSAEILEADFKAGIQRIIGEVGEFPEWGGERGDLYTTTVRLNRKRIQAAFAFKGRGHRGTLHPGDMGKRGDQIHSLFENDAQLFIVQHWQQVAPTMFSEMRIHALANAVKSRRPVYYCVVDGSDTARLMKAYPKEFIPAPAAPNAPSRR